MLEQRAYCATVCSPSNPNPNPNSTLTLTLTLTLTPTLTHPDPNPNPNQVWALVLATLLGPIAFRLSLRVSPRVGTGAVATGARAAEQLECCSASAS